MPKLYMNSRGGYYTRKLDQSGKIITLQINDWGADVIR
jgi:hypothetical protein